MKYVFTLILLCSCLAGFAQHPNCKKFRNGTFRILNTPRNYIITRHGNVQYEQFEGEAHKDRFFVNWLSDCVYTLIPDAAFLATNPGLPKNAMLTVTITSVKGKSYMQTTTMNFSDKPISAELILIKK